MSAIYKYNPEDFTGILGLSDDLTEFYKIYEDYQKDDTQDNLFALDRIKRELFFTIKHRKVEGSITPQMADELNEYLGALLYG